MKVFDFFCGLCSIGGLLVSLFTANKVFKISKTFNCGNKDDHSKIVNKGNQNTYSGSYTGRDSINGAGSTKQK